MKVKLTHDEVTSLMASRFAIDGASARTEAFVTQMNTFIGRHRARMEAIAKKVQKRVKGCPKTDIDAWDWSGIDQVTFEGEVEIPEEG